MNKLFIIILAVCLVSVHAFVKREAEPQSNANTAAELQESMKKLFETFSTKLSESFDPEVIKKNFNAVVDGVQKSIDQFKATTEAPKN